MKKIIIILFLTFIQIGYGQNEKTIDSLKNALVNAKTNLEKTKINYYLSLEFINNDIEQCQYYINETENLISEISTKDVFKANFFNTKAELFQKTNKYILSDSLYDISIKYAKRIKENRLYYVIKSENDKNKNNYYKGEDENYFNTLTLLEEKSNLLDSSNFKNLELKYSIIRNKGIALAGMRKLDDALILFKKNVAFYEKYYTPNNPKLERNLITSLNSLAVCNVELGNYSEALEIYFKALSFNTKGNTTEQINKIYGNISNLFLIQDDNEKAIKYASYINSESLNNNFTKHNNIGVANLKLNIFDQSKFHFLKAKSIVEKMNRKDKTGKLYRNLGIIYLELKKSDSSLYYLNKSMKLFKELNWLDETASINYSIGKLHYNNNDFIEAIPFMLKANEKFNEIGIINDIYLWNTENLYKSYKELKNDKAALLWLEKLHELNNKNYKNKDHLNVSELETKYQTQQKENEILQLSNENIKNEAALTKSRYTILGILGALLLILCFGYFYWNKRKQQYKLSLLENTLKTSELEKNRIGKELHDGIAGTLIKMVHETEIEQEEISYKLLETYNEVRNLSHQLNNTSYHGELFLDRMLDIIPENTETQQFKIQLDPHHLTLKEPYGTHLIRIIQELIANNLKYAKASKTQINISLKNDTLALIYKDNGVGTSDFKKGNGYKNMEDRLTLMKGHLEIKHQNSFSTTITIPYTI